jgi:hypothetical protein
MYSTTLRTLPGTGTRTRDNPTLLRMALLTLHDSQRRNLDASNELDQRHKSTSREVVGGMASFRGAMRTLHASLLASFFEIVRGRIILISRPSDFLLSPCSQCHPQHQPLPMLKPWMSPTLLHRQ